MTEHNFVAGDRVAFWDVNRPENRAEAVLVHCSETREGCSGLHMYNENDESLPFVDFNEAVVEHPEHFGYEIVTPFSEALPTVPGKYAEDYTARMAEAMPDIPEMIFDLLVEGMIESGEITPNNIWTLNEDGSWTDPEGTTKGVENNYMLVASNYKFKPVEGDTEASDDQPFA